RIAFVGQQIARPLPTEHVVGRVAPRRTLIGLVAREEIQEQRGLIEAPAQAVVSFRRAFNPAALEDLAEQTLARVAAQEDILARRVLIAVTRRDGDALDAQCHRLIEESGHLIGILAREERAVDGDAETLLARQANRGDRLVKHAFLANRLVMTLAVAI